MVKWGVERVLGLGGVALSVRRVMGDKTILLTIID